VKLMDLELAGLRDARPTDGSLVAKPSAEYLSPEQICRAPVTEKTDIYSFAVILYEMLCGVPPFQAETRDAVLEKHLTAPPPPTSAQAPGSSPPTSSARAAAPPPATTVAPAKPAVAPSPAAKATPPSAPLAAAPAAPAALSPAAKATPPSAPLAAAPAKP